MELYLIRHGTTDINQKKRYMGHLDIPMNENGKKQIRELKTRLADLNPDFLYLSDLKRCRETAALLRMPIQGIETPNLREINYGMAEGISYRELQKQAPEIAAAWAADWIGYTLPGGENYRSMARRVTDFISGLPGRTDPGCGVIISHGGCIGAILSYYLTGSEKNFWKFRVNTGSYAKLCFYAEDVYLEL